MTKTKKVMDEEIERFAQQYTESGQWKDGKIITPQMIQAFIHQSIIRILETAMEEVRPDMYIANSMKAADGVNEYDDIIQDRIDSILNSVKE